MKQCTSGGCGLRNRYFPLAGGGGVAGHTGTGAGPSRSPPQLFFCSRENIQLRVRKWEECWKFEKPQSQERVSWIADVIGLPDHGECSPKRFLSLSLNFIQLY